MQLIEPFLIIVMGGFVGFVAVALMLPLVQASQVVAH
jgi:type II secretory pathway component PulF